MYYNGVVNVSTNYLLEVTTMYNRKTTFKETFDSVFTNTGNGKPKLRFRTINGVTTYEMDRWEIGRCTNKASVSFKLLPYRIYYARMLNMLGSLYMNGRVTGNTVVSDGNIRRILVTLFDKDEIMEPTENIQYPAILFPKTYGVFRDVMENISEVDLEMCGMDPTLNILGLTMAIGSDENLVPMGCSGSFYDPIKKRDGFEIVMTAKELLVEELVEQNIVPVRGLFRIRGNLDYYRERREYGIEKETLYYDMEKFVLSLTECIVNALADKIENLPVSFNGTIISNANVNYGNGIIGDVDNSIHNSNNSTNTYKNKSVKKKRNSIF